MLKMRLQNWSTDTLNKYDVNLYKRAFKDLDSIYRYIAYDKLSPENAKEQVNRIKKAIFDLDAFPQSHQDRLVGRYADKGYKQLLIDNFVIIFKIDEKNKIVWVVTIQYYARRL